MENELNLKKENVFIRFIKESAKNGLLVFGIISIFSVSWFVIANFTQNNNQGFFLIDFNGNQDGIASAAQTNLRQNITVDIVAGVAKITSGFSSGFFTTTDIQPASFSSWNNIQIVAPVYSTIQDITGSLYTCGDTPVAIPGFQNMQFTGTNLVASISSLSVSTYPCIKVRVDMTNLTGNPNLTPLLDSLMVTWDPKPLFLVSVSSPTSVSAGSTYSALISYSNSFVDSDGVVVWMQLPTYLNGSIVNYTTSYNQNPQTTFSSATSGGIYTAGGTVVNGVNIPANSVYWNLGTVFAGKSGTLIVRINTQSGWQNGMVLNHLAHIKSNTGEEVISDSNSNQPGNQATETIIASSPSPVIKKNVSGVVTINGIDYVVSVSPFSPVITYTLILQNQQAPNGRETIFNPIIRDNISDILNKLTNICGVANPQVTRLSINNFGTYNPSTGIITWSVPQNSFSHIVPGGSASVSYTVDYTGCPSGVFNNIATAFGDNFSSVSDSKSVTVGLDTTPSGAVAKGDRVGQYQSITAQNDDNQTLIQTYGDNFSYLLYTRNSGAVAIGDIVMLDKIDSNLSFVSANLPSNIIGGQVYYNTGGSGNSPNSPPFYSLTGSGITGSGWTNIAPANPSDVRWVAFYVPCLNSSYFPSSPSNLNCVNQPSAVIATINLQIRTSANICLEQNIQNTGVFQIHRASPDISNSSLGDLSSPITYTDVESTHIGPSLADFSATSNISGPSFIQVGNNGTYTFTVSNTGNDTAQNTQLTIVIPKVNINGNLKYLDFISATGGNVTTIIDPLLSQIGTVLIDLGNISSGNSKTASITLNLPNGALNNSIFDIIGTISAQDDNNCRNITSTISKEVSVESSPLLQSFKSVKEKVIPGGDSVHYTLNFRNIGSSPSVNTYVIDRVPQKSVFEYAYTTGTDITGTTFSCSGCLVYFSKNINNLPASLNTSDPITIQDISAYFSLGNQITPGVWVPFGYPPEEVLWIAWKVDDNSFSNPILPADGLNRTVGFSVINDDNNYLPPSIPSPIGTLITNNSATIANNLPQAIGNQVFTTILPDPGLFLEKSSSKDYLRAGEVFDWNIQYYNDSGNPDTYVLLTDDLPSGVNIVDIYHKWNSVAVANGQSGVEVSILNNPSVNINGGLITFSPTVYKGGNLEKLEGGTLRLSVMVGNSVLSSTTLLNNILGLFENQSGSFSVSDNDEVYVENPDLWIRKQPDILDPVSGDIVNYTLIVSNEGFYNAPNVLISDTLPAGMCYVFGSTSIINSGWTLPEPIITGGPCATSSTTLTWDSVIQNISFPTGTIPGNSGDIFIRYRATVQNSVQPGTSLINGAHIETDIPENPVYPNDTSAEVITPYPDPYVIKQVQSVVNPGGTANYSIVYGNNTKQSASDSYIIDTLPDFDGDARTDMKIISVSGSHGEVFYYNSAPISANPPNFDLLNPTSNGWQMNWSSTTNHIAIVSGSLAGFGGPFTVSISLEATDPLSGNLLPTGISLTNVARIYLPSGIADQNLLNNESFATVVIPGIDLWVKKTGSAEGGFPGIGPNESIVYTVEFGNQGTEPACDVFLTDILSTGLSLASPSHNFNTLFITDGAGNQVFPVDTSGNLILTPVNISFSPTDFRFDIGNSNVCLPPGSRGEFQIFATTGGNLADGTTVSNTVVIGEDSPDVEDILLNNTDVSQTVVYRPDLMIQKSGVSKGPDDILGTGDDSLTSTALGENVHYTLAYNNIGSSPAQNAFIEETIPQGMCYIAGSINGYPSDATVVFSNNNGSSYNYSPVGQVDCSVTNFKVLFGSPIMPGNYIGEDINIGNMGTKTNVAQNGPAENRFLSLTNTVNPIYLSDRVDGLSTYGNRKDLAIDFNNDGLVDILNGSPYDFSLAIRNISTPGNISFDTSNAFPLPQFSAQPVLNDFNKDGLIDIVAVSDGLVSVLQNTSTLSQIQFSNYIDLPILNSQVIQASLVEDLNNDGFADVVIIEHGPAGNILAYKNISNLGGPIEFDTLNPSFVEPVFYSRNSSSFNYVFDIDGDGRKDILTSFGGHSTDFVKVFRNITDVSNDSNPLMFDTGIVINTVPVRWQNDLQIVDFNNDGKMDVLIIGAGLEGGVEVLQNNSTSGNISFSNQLLFQNGYRNFAKAKIFDVDKDGFLDIVVPLGVSGNFQSPSENVFVFRNNTTYIGSNINFATPITVFSSPVEIETRPVVEDFDKDSRNDLILRLRNSLAIIRNITQGSGSLSFDSPFFYSLPGEANQAYYPDLLVVDIDQNGKKDIIAPGFSGITGIAPSIVLQNNSTPGLIKIGSSISLGPTSNYWSIPIWEDFDNGLNGNKDLVLNPFNNGTYAFQNNSIPGLISFGNNTTSGSYVIPISISSGFWQKLQVKHQKPSGTDIKYTIYNNTCGGTPLMPTTSLPNQFIDISFLGSTNNLCLVIEFETVSPIVSPILDAWQMLYTGGSMEKIEFELQVANSGNAPQTLLNTATIGTDSYEITYDNNTSDYTLTLAQADVQITKIVDKATANLGDTLIYTLNYRNNGPLDAHNVLINDSLPAGVNPISWTQISGAPISCSINYTNNTVNCFNPNTPDWVLSVGESGSIQIQAEIVSSVSDISLTHTTQSDFTNGGTGEYYSLTNIPGSVVPVNISVTTDLQVDFISSFYLEAFDQYGNPIETTYSVSDLVNFSIASLDPFTLVYNGPSTDIASLFLYMDILGPGPDYYFLSLEDTTASGNVDFYSWGTNLQSDFGAISTPINWSLPIYLKNISPGFSQVFGGGSVLTAPFSYYRNSFQMPATVCFSGNRKWGYLSLTKNDPQNSVSVYLSGNSSFNSPLLLNPSMTIEDLFLSNAQPVPSTLYYQLSINRNDPNYIPEIEDISINTYCSGSNTPNGLLVNTANITTSTRDTNLLNNTSSVATFLGDVANIAVSKTGPPFISIGTDFFYTIVVSNNGNITADNIFLNDILPSQVQFISTTSFGSISFNCSGVSAISCSGSGPLLAGESATILLRVRVPNSNALIGQTLYNEVTVGTTTPELTILDNFDSFDLTIIPKGNSNISGYIYFDANSNNEKDSFENAIEGVSVFLAGKDIFGNVYGPDKATYPSAYEKSMDTLLSMSLIPNRSYSAFDPYPPRFLPLNSMLTNQNGFYSFSGLNPGTYMLLEIQPNGFTSTGSNAGYRNVDSLGNPIFDIVRDGDGTSEITGGILDNNDPDMIISIIMGDSENLIEYNFGEINGSIGDQVFDDVNGDGIFNNSEVGIAGVEISLYNDTNFNGLIDPGEFLSTTFTDANGKYLFSGLRTSGVRYIIKVTDSTNVLSSYNAIIGPNPGANNNAQNPNGYIVTLSSSDSINITADFGYRSPSSPPPGGGGGSNPPNVLGAIGNLVFFDENVDGIYQQNELGIPGVEVSLATDINRNGIYDSGEPIRKMLTNEYGIYQFVALDISYQYIVFISPQNNNTLMEFSPTLGPNQTADNNSKNRNGYLVQLTALSPSNQTADFGFAGYELPRTGQSAFGRIIFGLIILMVTILCLNILNNEITLTKLINGFKIQSNGK